MLFVIEGIAYVVCIIASWVHGVREAVKGQRPHVLFWWALVGSSTVLLYLGCCVAFERHLLPLKHTRLFEVIGQVAFWLELTSVVLSFVAFAKYQRRSSIALLLSACLALPLLAMMWGAALTLGF